MCERYIFPWKTSEGQEHYSRYCTVIKDLEPEESYNYLGVTEGDGIQHSSMREKSRKKCFHRVRSILRSELNARNRINAINSLALPVVTYSFTIINWSLTEIKLVKKHEQNKRMYSVTSNAKKYLNEINLST